MDFFFLKNITFQKLNFFFSKIHEDVQSKSEISSISYLSGSVYNIKFLSLRLESGKF